MDSAPPSQPMAALPPLHAVGRVNRRQTAEAKAPPQLVLRLSSSYTDTHMCTHAHAHNHVTTAMGGGCLGDSCLPVLDLMPPPAPAMLCPPGNPPPAFPHLC